MPRLLETHGCQGGAHAGYVRAGWDVTGVDINDTTHIGTQLLAVVESEAAA